MGKSSSKSSPPPEAHVEVEIPVIEVLAKQVAEPPVKHYKTPPGLVAYVKLISGTVPPDHQLDSYWQVFEKWCLSKVKEYDTEFKFVLAMRKMRLFCADASKTKAQKQDEMKRVYNAFINPSTAADQINIGHELKYAWAGKGGFPLAVALLSKAGAKHNYAEHFLDASGNIGPLIDPNSANSLWTKSEKFIIWAFDQNAIPPFKNSPEYKNWLKTADGQGWLNPSQIELQSASTAHRGYNNELVMDKYYTQSVSAPRQRTRERISGGYRSHELYGNDASVYGHSYAMDPMSILIIVLAMAMLVCCVIVVNGLSCVGAYFLGRFQSEKSKGNRNDIEEMCVQND